MRSRGFTLIEVLVAIVVIGLAATAASKGMRATTNLLGANSLHAEAITYTQEALEDLRTLRYDDMKNGSSVSDDGRFTTSWTVDRDTPRSGMKFITARTTWDWRGERQAYTLHTVYSRITPN